MNTSNMSGSNTESANTFLSGIQGRKKVVIIGAGKDLSGFQRKILTHTDVLGSTGIALAHGLKKVYGQDRDSGSDIFLTVLIRPVSHSSFSRKMRARPARRKVTPIDFASTMCFTKHTREHALFLRSQLHHPLYHVGPPPNGYCAWLSLHDGDDVEHPEVWTIFHYISFPEKRDVVNNRTMWEHVIHQKELARRFVDPWRSVFEWMPDDSEVWYSKLRNWDPSLPNHQWDNRQGRVTLAGDAAHPMTFQHGQGLNHSIQDAYTACKAIESFWNRGDFTIEQRANAIQLYEDEMIARTGEEARLSEENSMKMYDWKKIMQSPTMLEGMAVDK